MPDISSATALEHNPFTPIHHSGDRISFTPIQFIFKVSEDLGNYLEIFRWMEALGFPEEWAQYRALKQAMERNRMDTTGLFCDFTIFVADSTDRPIMEFVFHHAFPVGLGGFTLDTTMADVEYSTSKATFNYTHFTINPVERAICNVA